MVPEVGPTRSPGREPWRKPGFAFPVAGLAILAHAHFVTGDSTVLGEWLVVWPPVGWLLLLAPRLGLLLHRGERREATWLGVLGLALVLTTTWPELRPLWRRPDALSRARHDELRERPAPPTLALRVVTWNVSATTPLEVLAPLAPDLVLFTECGSLEPAARHPAFASHQRVFGLDPCALSRFPARSLASERVGAWQEPLLLRVEPPAGPSFLAVGVRLTLPAPVVALAAFEGWNALVTGHRERILQYERLASLIERTRAREGHLPVVLAGDFNVPGGMRSLSPLGRSLRDVWFEAGVGWGGTMTESWPVSRIDQVWVSQEISAVEAAVYRGAPSDHRLVMADLLIDSRPPRP